MQIYWQREWQRARRVVGNVARHWWVRWTHREGDIRPIFANSFPKSGTYMLSRCLELMPTIVAYHRGVWLAHAGKMRPSERRRELARLPLGSYVSGHLAYLPEQVAVLRDVGLRPVMIVRDPRDVATSYYTFEMKYRWLPHYRFFNQLATNDERLMAMIRGDVAYGLGPLAASMQTYTGWLDDPECLIVKFEDLVGAQGGGSDERQRAAVASIAQHVGLALDDSDVQAVAGQVFNRGAQTFRKGVIGDWRNHFSAEHVAAFNESGGQMLLEKYGYL